MQLNEFVKQTEFSSGLPQGDTHFELAKTTVEPIERKGTDGKTTTAYQLTKDTGEKYFVPKSVLATIKDLASKGATKIRITRVGFALMDTKYTVVTGH